MWRMLSPRRLLPAALVVLAATTACTAGRTLNDRQLPEHARDLREALPGDAAVWVRLSSDGWRELQQFLGPMAGPDAGRGLTEYVQAPLHENEDPRRIVQSLRQVAALAPARMFDAHRGEVRTPVRAIMARVAFLEETMGTIERRIADGWSDRAIVREILGGEELVAWLSHGEYARRNVVRAVRRSLAAT